MAVETNLRTPQQLYEDWERSHWAVQDIDLNRDLEQWAVIEERERSLLYWVLSSLMVAEERISTQFCGLVLAQDDEEEGSFLATQLVDEVRHMQFYARFQNEVVRDPASIAAHVERARQVLGDPFRKVFDRALVQAHERLRTDPTSREAKVDFVTVYHMVIEGTLGITASHFLLDFLHARELLPGFADGYGRIAADEQRHIAYGTEFLRRAVADDPAMADVIRSRLFDLLPAVAESVAPPSDGAWDVLGVEDGELGAYGLDALTRPAEDHRRLARRVLVNPEAPPASTGVTSARRGVGVALLVGQAPAGGNGAPGDAAAAAGALAVGTDSVPHAAQVALESFEVEWSPVVGIQAADVVRLLSGEVALAPTGADTSWPPSEPPVSRSHSFAISSPGSSSEARAAPKASRSSRSRGRPEARFIACSASSE